MEQWQLLLQESEISFVCANMSLLFCIWKKLNTLFLTKNLQAIAQQTIALQQQIPF